MASRRTLLPVLLLAFALVAAGGLMEGVRGAPRSSSSMSSVRRRLADHPVGARAATASKTCPKCFAPLSTCCPPFCVDTQIDIFNCGGCGKVCKLGSFCCGGVCLTLWDFQSDLKNCGVCGNKCGPHEKCFLGLCSYNG